MVCCTGSASTCSRMRCSPICSPMWGGAVVPPMIVAVVMVLQRIEGLSDREAVERFAFDARWKYAAGGLDFDYPGFVHTVLVDMRARLARSDRPNRIFEVTLEAAKAAGLVGRKRVLDSTPLYDAVATMDTVTLVRSAIRGLLKVADAELAAELRALVCRDDDYAAAGKPVCDYDDAAARAALVDGLEAWLASYRPMSPDGLPYVGRFAGFSNFTAACGHAMLGVTLGPITGQLVAETLTGRKPRVEMRLLSPDRFA